MISCCQKGTFQREVKILQWRMKNGGPSFFCLSSFKNYLYTRSSIFALHGSSWAAWPDDLHKLGSKCLYLWLHWFRHSIKPVVFKSPINIEVLKLIRKHFFYLNITNEVIETNRYRTFMKTLNSYYFGIAKK